MSANADFGLFACLQQLDSKRSGGRTGFHRSYIADIERGARNISFDTLANFAQAFEMTISELCNGMVIERIQDRSG